MKKKAKVDWKKVWKAYNNQWTHNHSKNQRLVQRLVESQLSHKPKKVKGRK